MLAKVGLKNFKALRAITLPLGRVTVLIGPNGTGKSSVLQALALLKQSIGAPQLITQGQAIDLGHYDDVVHRPARENVIEFRLVAPVREVKVVWRARTVVYQQPFREAAYEARFDSKGLLEHGLHLSGEQPIRASWSRTGKSEVRPRQIEAGPVTVKLAAAGVAAQVLRVSGLQHSPDVDPSSVEATRAAFEGLFATTHEALSRTYIVPAIRGFDKPAYPLQAAPVDDFFTDRGPEGQASRVLSTIAYRRELEEEISKLSERILRLSMRIKLIPDKKVSAEAYNGSRTNLVNEGFGANQLMVLLAQMVVAPEGSLLGIEEPEIHLHPRAQAMLAEIFAELATREGKQILLTTHNEHVLIGLLTQVAEGKLRAEDLAVYYFDKEGPAAKATKLAVDEKGGLKGGLRGFFEADIEQAERRLQALVKKSGK